MLSFPHLVVLFLIALMVFGPEKLPELARMLGKFTAEVRRMTTDFRSALEDEVRDLDRQARVRESATATPPAGTTSRTPLPPSDPAPTPAPEPTSASSGSEPATTHESHS